MRNTLHPATTALCELMRAQVEEQALFFLPALHERDISTKLRADRGATRAMLTEANKLGEIEHVATMRGGCYRATHRSLIMYFLTKPWGGAQ